jgi:uncharacterized protein YgiM (DUF1202 family)
MRFLFLIMSFIILAAGSVQAAMVAVSGNLAEIRSSPSPVLSRVILQVPRYYPLSVEESQGDFLKVTDYLGNTGWIAKSRVEQTRTIVVKAEKVNLRKGPGQNNPIIFKAQEGVAFKVIGEKDDWLEVQHESGMTGWIFKDLVWNN